MNAEQYANLHMEMLIPNKIIWISFDVIWISFEDFCLSYFNLQYELEEKLNICFMEHAVLIQFSLFLNINSTVCRGLSVRSDHSAKRGQ